MEQMRMQTDTVMQLVRDQMEASFSVFVFPSRPLPLTRPGPSTNRDIKNARPRWSAHEAVACMRAVKTMAKIDAMHATDARLQQILKPIRTAIGWRRLLRTAQDDRQPKIGVRQFSFGAVIRMQSHVLV